MQIWTRLHYKLKTIRWLKNWLPIWKANRGLSEMPHFHFRNGLILQHGPGDIPWDIFAEIFLEDCYGSETFYKPKSTDIILDIGANIGVFALYTQSVAPGAKVFCFEPAETTRMTLEKNIQNNTLQGKVHIFPYGLWNKETMLKLPKDKVSGNRSLFGENPEPLTEPHTESILCIPFEKAIDLTGAAVIDLVKMDIEGAEVQALINAPESSLRKVRHFVIEYHDHLVPNARQQITEKLKLSGFKTFQDLKYTKDAGILRAKQ